MGTTSSGQRTRTIIALVVFIAALSYSGWQYRTNADLEARLDEQRLQSESLLSEKLSLEKNIDLAKTRQTDLDRRNKDLQRQLVDLSKESDGKDAAISRIQRELASNKKKLSSLESSRLDLEQQLAALNNSNQQLLGEKEDLNAALSSMQVRNQELGEELNRAHVAYYDRPLVEPLRGKNDKLMVKASRTQRLRATVMLPSNLKELNFKITNPAGDLISTSPSDGMLAVRVMDNGSSTTASSEKGAVQSYNQVEMLFQPRKKLVAGVYTIAVESEGLTVGTFQIRLR